MTVDEDLRDVQGKVFLIPFANDAFILAQVGFGGDLGIFRGTYSKDIEPARLNPPLLFRVHFGRVSPSNFNWIDCGTFPYKGALQKPQAYVHRPIGLDECTLVTFGGKDEPISCYEASRYEPLATWSHEHILRRFEEEGRSYPEHDDDS